MFRQVLSSSGTSSGPATTCGGALHCNVHLCVGDGEATPVPHLEGDTYMFIVVEQILEICLKHC